MAQLPSIRQPTDMIAQHLIDGLIDEIATGLVTESQMLADPRPPGFVTTPSPPVQAQI